MDQYLVVGINFETQDVEFTVVIGSDSDAAIENVYKNKLNNIEPKYFDQILAISSNLKITDHFPGQLK